MISFSKLGRYGRLGNQLFQYAFLRSHARRLRTNFYCGSWDGDKIFDLDDDKERSSSFEPMPHHWGPGAKPGFSIDALSIADQTEIEGFFQSERYYDEPTEVRAWFQFKSSVVEAARQVLPGVSIESAVSLSIRIDSDYEGIREYFPLYSLKYYYDAVSRCSGNGPLIVFADRPDLARHFFSSFRSRREIYFIERVEAPIQLYLMSRCQDNVITNSTFAWWGAWLNPRPQKVVVCPKHWNRPGVPQPVLGIDCENWQRVDSLIPFWDHFQTWRFRHPVTTARRVLKRRLERAPAGAI